MIRSILPNSIKREIVLGAKIVIALASVFLCFELIQPQYFLWDDNGSFFLPCYDHSFKSLIDERCMPWMLWNHNLGQTFLTKIQEGFFYPPIYLMGGLSRLLTGDTFWTIDFLVIFHLIFAGLGISLFLKQFNFSDAYRFAGAFLYVTTPFGIILCKSWVVSSYAICMMPWALLAIEKIGKESGLSSCFPFIFVQAFFFLNGYVQFWFQANFVLFLYIILRRTYQDSWNLRVALPKLFGSAIIAIGLIYPLISMGLESKKDSFERAAGYSLDFLSLYRVNLLEYVYAQFGLFSPEVFAGASSLIYWNGMLIAFGLAIIIPILKNEKMPRLTRLFFLLSFLILFISVGLFVVLYWIPPYNSFRFPFRWILFLSVFLVPLFLLTVQNVTQNKRNIAHGILLLISLWNLSAYLHAEAWSGFTQMRLQKRKEISVTWWDKNYRCVHLTNFWSDVCRANLRAQLLPTLIDRISYFGYDVLLSRGNFEAVSPFSRETTHSMPIEVLEQQQAKTEKWSGRYLAAFPSSENITAIEKLNHVSKIAEVDGIVIYENLNAVPLIHFEANPQQPVPWEIKNNRIVVYPEKKSGTIHLQFLAIPYLKIALNNQVAENIPAKQDSIEWDLPTGIDRVEVYYENPKLENSLKWMGYSWILFFVSFGAVKYRQIRQRCNKDI